MIRAFAIGLAIATMRLIFMPAMMPDSTRSATMIATLSTGAFAKSFAVHTVVAELRIRRTRPAAGRLADPSSRPVAPAPRFRSGEPGVAGR